MGAKSDDRVAVIVLKDGLEYRDWIQDVSEASLIPISRIVRSAIKEWAVARGYPPPPDRRRFARPPLSNGGGRETPTPAFSPGVGSRPGQVVDREVAVAEIETAVVQASAESPVTPVEAKEAPIMEHKPTPARSIAPEGTQVQQIAPEDTQSREMKGKGAARSAAKTARAEEIRDLRRRRPDMPQIEIAKRVKCDPAEVSKVLKGFNGMRRGEMESGISGMEEE